MKVTIRTQITLTEEQVMEFIRRYPSHIASRKDKDVVPHIKKEMVFGAMWQMQKLLEDVGTSTNDLEATIPAGYDIATE